MIDALASWCCQIFFILKIRCLNVSLRWSNKMSWWGSVVNSNRARIHFLELYLLLKICLKEVANTILYIYIYSSIYYIYSSIISKVDIQRFSLVNYVIQLLIVSRLLRKKDAKSTTHWKFEQHNFMEILKTSFGRF